MIFPPIFPQDPWSQALVDSDLLTLSAVGRSTGAEEVDLSGGKLLSDLALGRWDPMGHASVDLLGLTWLVDDTTSHFLGWD